MMDQVPWILNKRAERETTKRLGQGWSPAHDRYAARLLFKWEAIDAEELDKLLKRTSRRKPRQSTSPEEARRLY